MIRYAENKDLNGIVALWQSVFGDDERIIKKFLSVHFCADNTVIYEDAGNVVAMFFLLEGEIAVDSNRYPSRYLYAACTLPEFRGRGIMADMIAFAQNESAEKGYDYICLLPAEDSLYRYYERFGFKTLYGVNRFTFNSSDESELIAAENNADIFELREHNFYGINSFVWSKKAVDFAIEFNKFYGGEAFATCKGYVLYNSADSKITVKEIACQNFDVIPLLNFLSRKCGCSQIEVLMPCTDGNAEKHGMILPLNYNAHRVLPDNFNIYLGLTLD